MLSNTLLSRTIVGATIAVLMSALLQGCGASTTEPDALDTAIEAMEEKDYPAALEILDGSRQSVLDDGDIERMVRLSILYMKLADVNDSEEMVGYAYQCLTKAYSTDSAATAEYINTLSVDDLSQANAVKTIIGAAGMMSFHDDGEFLDSLFINEQEPQQ